MLEKVGEESCGAKLAREDEEDEIEIEGPFDGDGGRKRFFGAEIAGVAWSEQLNGGDGRGGSEAHRGKALERGLLKKVMEKLRSCTVHRC